MYLLEGKHAPDHATIARFRTIHFAPCATRIMAHLTNYLKDIGDPISGKQIFIDGTKIEACAGRVTQYECKSCKDCPLKPKCIKGNNWKMSEEERFKKLTVPKVFARQRKECLERITSEEGILLRMNRSVQVEGSFGVLKEDRNFRRFLCRGKENVYAECVILALSHNILKLHRKIQNDRTQTHLFPLKAA